MGQVAIFTNDATPSVETGNDAIARMAAILSGSVYQKPMASFFISMLSLPPAKKSRQASRYSSATQRWPRLHTLATKPIATSIARATWR